MILPEGRPTNTSGSSVNIGGACTVLSWNGASSSVCLTNVIDAPLPTPVTGFAKVTVVPLTPVTESPAGMPAPVATMPTTTPVVLANVSVVAPLLLPALVGFGARVLPAGGVVQV